MAAPVADGELRTLIARLSTPVSGRGVDLGCGSGVWLLELLSQHEGLVGYGVDLAVPPDAAARADRLGLTNRVSWVQADATTWRQEPCDVVLCIGASHAFGGLIGTLAGVRRHLRPGGQVLLGDAFWEQPPGAVAQRVLQAGPEDFPDLPGLVDTVQRHGFEVSYAHTSTLGEWDAYEWSWTGSLVDWALREAPTGAARQQALDVARQHRHGWLHGYRQQLGFATLVLNDASDSPAPADAR